MLPYGYEQMVPNDLACVPEKGNNLASYYSGLLYQMVRDVTDVHTRVGQLAESYVLREV